MADLLFLKRGDGQIMKLEGDNMIHEFVEITREAYDHVQVVRDVYKGLCLIEHDPRVRDRIMARLFLVPRFTKLFDWLSKNSLKEFELVINEFKDCLSYSQFPASMEFDRQMERKAGFGYGGALMRSLSHIPRETSTYFQQQWFMGSKV
ncbi:hypothetical protein Lser_V15G15767 [Lactuca serriola]